MVRSGTDYFPEKVSYALFCVFIQVDYLTVCGFGSVDEETGTPSLQYASTGSWGLSDDMQSWDDS